jgi:hypothetical protein
MKWETLTIEHKSKLYNLLKNTETKIAEYSFANIYLFRKHHEYEVLMKDDFILIKGKSYDGKKYIMPLNLDAFLKSELIDEMLKEIDFIFPIDEAWLTLFSQDKYDFFYKDGDTDYVYNIEKMRSFAGKKLHGKRNLIHQFEKSYTCEPLPLFGEERLKDAKKILEVWQEESGQTKEETDFDACMEALELYEELVLCGFIYYVDGKPAGFIIGEELCEDTFALHFAKGMTVYKGIYQFMFNNFSKILPDKYKFVNFEQDLDKENLRLAKMSYEPDLLVKKYRVKKLNKQ